jgi:hypothetical protein
MAYNASQAFNSPLELYGGLYEDMSPWDLPEGLSPDCQNVWFLPGSVSTRPALSRFIAAIAGTPTIMSVKDFPDPSGDFVKVFLDSTGSLKKKDGITGVVSIIDQVAAGVQFKAENAFNKQWYAFFGQQLADDFSENPFVGVDIPRYYDGHNLWRVTQDAPGAPPGAVNESLTFSIVASPNGLLLDPQAIAASPAGLTQSGNTVKIVPNSTLTNKPWQIGDWITVVGATNTAYNGTYQISAIETNPIVIYFVHPQSGLAASGGGQFVVHVGEVVTTAANSFTAGQSVTITAASDPGWDGTFPIRSIVDSTHFFIVLGQNLPGDTGTVFPGAVLLNGWGAFGHVGDYEAGVSQGHSHPPITDGGTTAAYTNAGNAIDDDPATYADSTIQGSHTYAGCVWGFTNPGLVVANFLTLTIISSVPANGTDGLSVNNRTATIWYSQDSGATWTLVYDVGGPTGRAQQTDTISITPGTDPTHVQVMAFNDAHDDMVHRVNLVALGPTGTNSGGGTVSSAGNVVQGVHHGVLMFESENGAITAPSVPFSWTADGSERVVISGILIGPPGTAKRILAFTPAGGSSYYYIPPSVLQDPNGGPPMVTQGTVIDDNTATSISLDFTDVQLTNGVQIDIDGNNLFQQVVLAPCLGVIEYQSRLAWWGEINNIKNLLNTGFDGGSPTTSPSGIPPGWANTDSTGGTGQIIVADQQGLGFAYKMTSAGGAKDCLIEQSGYQNYYGAPIFFPNTDYTFRVLAKISLTGGNGHLRADLISATSGTLATASLDVAGLTTDMAWYVADFDNTLPAAIPSDTMLRIYLDTVTAALVITLDEAEFINADQPVLFNQSRVSYANNPFGYDALTGLIGIDSTESLVGAFKQRGFLYLLSDHSQFQTQNNGSTEPADWNVNEYANKCGCSSPCAVDYGVSVAWWAGKNGVQVFNGDPPKKLTQELQPTWDGINWDAQLTIWVCNDSIQRVLYVGIPQTNIEAPAWDAPSTILPMSYRNIDVTNNIPDPLASKGEGFYAPSLARKWNKWPLFINCAAIVQNQSGVNGTRDEIVFGNGNGGLPGAGNGTGELYTLDFTKFQDDDYGTFVSYYTTYAFWGAELQKSIPDVGTHRKLFIYLSAYVSGVGTVVVTPLVDRLGNAWTACTPYLLTMNPNHDLEWPLNVLGERVFYKFSVAPNGDGDAYFALNDVTVAGRMDKVFPVRGAYL